MLFLQNERMYRIKDESVYSLTAESDLDGRCDVVVA